MDLLLFTTSIKRHFYLDLKTDTNKSNEEYPVY